MAYADRLAKAGYAVIAPDMFHGQVATERDDAERLAKESDAGGADAIAFAAVDHLAERLGPGAPLAVLGFSFGAAYALWAPSERDRIVASVVYYGTYTGEFLSQSKAPVLGHFAENDEFEPDEGVRDLEQALTDAGREVTIHRYPGTGHWFAEPSRDAYDAEAAELAFDRTIDFLGRSPRRRLNQGGTSNADRRGPFPVRLRPLGDQARPGRARRSRSGRLVADERRR